MVCFPTVTRDITFSRIVWTGSGAHPAFYSVGSVDSYAGCEAAGVKPISFLHLILRLRVRGGIPPPSHVFSWRGAKLSTGTGLSLNFKLVW